MMLNYIKNVLIDGFHKGFAAWFENLVLLNGNTRTKVAGGRLTASPVLPSFCRPSLHSQSDGAAAS